MTVFDRVGRSIRGKIMLLVLAATISALAVNAVGLVIYDLRSYEKQWSSDLDTQAQVLARASAPALSFGDRGAAEKDLSVMQVRPRIAAAALYTRDGKLFATYAKPGEAQVEFPAAPGADGYVVRNKELVLFRRMVENGEPVGTVHLRAHYDPWERLKDYLTILAAVMVASLVVTALFSSWLQNALTTPILEVARVAREVVEKRNYSMRARKTTRDEIGQLVDAFNGMLAEVGRRAEQVRDADRRKDEFLATLAHELRNPLAPIRNALEILRLVGSDPVKAKMAREMMQRQVSQMVRLVDDLLDVSRITTGKLAVRTALLDVRSVVRDAVEAARPFVESRDQALEIDLDPTPIQVQGDATRLAQVLANLLNNAAKYTEPGGHIVIIARAEEGQAVVRVRDNGIGLAQEAIETIFDMFVQVDRSLERSQAGLGVGLTLARRLVELHHGTIEVRSEGSGRGSEFIVRLPLSSAPAAD